MIPYRYIWYEVKLRRTRIMNKEYFNSIAAYSMQKIDNCAKKRAYICERSLEQHTGPSEFMKSNE